MPPATAQGGAVALQLAKLEHMGRVLWEALGKRAEEVAPEMDAICVADVLEAYAKLNKPIPPTLLAVMGQRLTKVRDFDTETP